MTAARMTRIWDGSYRVTFPYHPGVVEGIKNIVPSHSRVYDPDQKAWFVASAYERIIRQLLEDVFITVETDSERTAPPRQATGSTDTYAVLHLLPTAPPELVESAYRCLSRLHHPDVGGNTTMMQRINAAASTIRKRGA
jgi:hypothetical protein